MLPLFSYAKDLIEHCFLIGVIVIVSHSLPIGFCSSSAHDMLMLMTTS